MISKALIIKLITIASLKFGVDPNVAVAVAIEESRLKPNAVGELNEVGLFQLLPGSFPKYTEAQLADPQMNIKLGVKYLAKAKQHCYHKDGINWLVCYNYGFENAKKVKHPSLFPYVKRVAKIMKERKRYEVNNNYNYFDEYCSMY